MFLFATLHHLITIALNDATTVAVIIASLLSLLLISTGLVATTSIIVLLYQLISLFVVLDIVIAIVHAIVVVAFRYAYTQFNMSHCNTQSP